MKRYLIDFIILFLLIIALIQTTFLFLLQKSASVKFIKPLNFSKKEYEKFNSISLENPKFFNELIDKKCSYLGELISIEDVIRGLLYLLENNNKLKLTEQQKKKLRPLIKNIYDLRMQLLECQSRKGVLERNMKEETFNLIKDLSEEDLENLYKVRDEASIINVENKYWEEVIKKLGKNAQ